MKPVSIVYGMLCLGVIVLFSMAAGRSYSPFADGGRPMFFTGGGGGGHGVGGARGPTHK